MTWFIYTMASCGVDFNQKSKHHHTIAINDSNSDDNTTSPDHKEFNPCHDKNGNKDIITIRRNLTFAGVSRTVKIIPIFSTRTRRNSQNPMMENQSARSFFCGASVTSHAPELISLQKKMKLTNLL
jgi:hypothetical protein